MSYTEGQISGVSTTVGVDLLAAFNTALVAVTGWTQVHSSSASSIQKYVWKCDSTYSGLPSDWYLIMWCATTGTTAQTVFFSMAETWDSGTSSAQHLPLANHATDSSCRRSSAASAITNATTSIGLSNSSGSTYVGKYITVSQGSYWFINVFADRVTFSTSLGYGYVGAFDSLVVTPSTNDPLPLVCHGTNLNVGLGSGWTDSTPLVNRQAMSPSNAAVAWIYKASAQSGAAGGPAISGYVQTDPWTGNTGVLTTPLLLQLDNSTSGQGVGQTNVYGVWRGRFKGVVTTAVAGTAFADTLTNGSDVYTRTSTGTYWFLKG